MSDLISLSLQAQANSIAKHALWATISSSIASVVVGVIAVAIAHQSGSRQTTSDERNRRDAMIRASIGILRTLNLLDQHFSDRGDSSQPTLKLAVNLNRGIEILSAARKIIDGVVEREIGNVGLYELAIRVQGTTEQIYGLLNRRRDVGNTYTVEDHKRSTVEIRADLNDARTDLAQLRRALDLPNPEFDSN